MKPREVDAFYAALAKERPEPKSELEYVNAYTLLVAVMLSAQATDAGVNKATRPLFQKVRTPQAMIRLGDAGLREALKSINFFNTKARHVMAMSVALVERFGGKVPDNRADLESLAGVGRKTANVVLNVAFGQPTMAVDTHVFRVANRTGLAPGKTPEDVEAALLAVTPEKWRQHAHHWLILHGRYVCKAKNPACAGCVVRRWCEWEGKGLLKKEPGFPPSRG